MKELAPLKNLQIKTKKVYSILLYEGKNQKALYAVKLTN